VAEDLEQLGHWHKHLHDLGDTEVKHGAHVSVVNLYTSELGNPEVPQRFRSARQKTAVSQFGEARPSAKRWPLMAGVAVVLFLAIGAFFWLRRTPSKPTEVGPAKASTSTSLAGVSEKSIAVLPFENLSRDPDNAFFTDGVQDEILTDLAKIADLKVISRTSVMQYKTGTQRNLREICQ
jgi:hypothetical protein